MAFDPTKFGATPVQEESTNLTFNREQAGQAGDNADALIKAALQRPRGDPQRTAMLQKAHAMTTEATGQASERQSQIPSNKKTLTDVGFTTLDLLGGGTYGKAALGLTLRGLACCLSS